MESVSAAHTAACAGSQTHLPPSDRSPSLPAPTPHHHLASLLPEMIWTCRPFISGIFNLRLRANLRAAMVPPSGRGSFLMILIGDVTRVRKSTKNGHDPSPEGTYGCGAAISCLEIDQAMKEAVVIRCRSLRPKRVRNDSMAITVFTGNRPRRKSASICG